MQCSPARCGPAVSLRLASGFLVVHPLLVEGRRGGEVGDVGRALRKAYLQRPTSQQWHTCEMVARAICA